MLYYTATHQALARRVISKSWWYKVPTCFDVFVHLTLQSVTADVGGTSFSLLGFGGTNRKLQTNFSPCSPARDHYILRDTFTERGLPPQT
jgi:hypothetical protein